jgi:hypothetical protein
VDDDAHGDRNASALRLLLSAPGRSVRSLSALRMAAIGSRAFRLHASARRMLLGAHRAGAARHLAAVRLRFVLTDRGWARPFAAEPGVIAVYQHHHD